MTTADVVARPTPCVPPLTRKPLKATNRGDNKTETTGFDNPLHQVPEFAALDRRASKTAPRRDAT